MEISLKFADDSDLHVLLNMVRDYHEYDHIPFDEGTIRQVLQKLIQDSSLGRAWLIKSGNQIAGYVLLTFGYSVEYGGKNAFMDELFIKTEFRGKGIGNQVIPLVKQHAKDFGLKAIHLEAERQNLRAIHLYRKLGFHDPDRVLMTHWLK